MMVRAKPLSWMRTVVLAVCTVTLTWMVVSRSLAAYLAEAAPQTALWLNPHDPIAPLNLADRALNRSQGSNEGPGEIAQSSAEPGKSNAVPDKRSATRDFSEFNLVAAQEGVDLHTIRAWATDSLVNAPLNARALRLLGQATAAAGDRAAASKLMQTAARLSLHESIAVYWLLAQSAEAKDYTAVLYYADALLRTLPGFDPYVMPILARVAEDKASAGLLKTALLANPPWRSNFLQALPRVVGDERTPLDLLLALRASGRPPTRMEINSYLDFLVQNKMYELAYYTWLQFLPPQELGSAGLLYNGSFEADPTGSPFDWRITQGSGVVVDIEQRPDKAGDHALVIDFEFGRVDYHSVKQLLMLAPGRYVFEGRQKGELVGPRGLKWRIACAEEPAKPFAESAMIRGAGSNWSDAKLDFTVPEQNCRAQYLSLDLDSRMPSEQFVSGSIRFDDLRILRVAGAPGE